jgi:hypothetical protein
MPSVTAGISAAARLGLVAGIPDDVARLTGRDAIGFATVARDHAAA